MHLMQKPKIVFTELRIMSSIIIDQVFQYFLIITIERSTERCDT